MREFLRVGDCNVEMMRTGAGAPLLFLHAGDGIDPARRLVGELARSFDVIAPSHPGFDGSELPEHFSTVDDLAYHYLEFMERLDLRDIAIVGCSLGAWIAAEIAIKSCERISSLTLINPVGAKFDGREERQLADVFYYAHRDMRKILYADGLRDDRDFSAMPQEDVTRFVRNRESFTLFGWSPLLHDPKLRHRLKRIRVSVMVLSGSADRVAPPAYARTFAEHFPSGEFCSLSNVGHYAHDERPEELAGIARDFIRSKKG